MTTSELPIAVRRRGKVAVIDMVGDVNARAEGSLDEAWAEAVREQPEAVVLNFEGTGFINSTGIALIVGLLAAGRAGRSPSAPTASPRTTARSSRSRGWRTSWRSTPTRTAPFSAWRGAAHD